MSIDAIVFFVLSVSLFEDDGPWMVVFLPQMKPFPELATSRSSHSNFRLTIEDLSG